MMMKDGKFAARWINNKDEMFPRVRDEEILRVQTRFLCDKRPATARISNVESIMCK